MYVCMYACMYVCMYVCVCIYIYIYIYIYVAIRGDEEHLLRGGGLHQFMLCIDLTY